MPLGMALALFCGPVFISLSSWQAWWLLLAVQSGVMAVVLWRGVPSDAARLTLTLQHPGLGATLTVSTGRGPTWQLRLRQTLNAPGPWLVALCFAVYSGQWLAVVGFLPSIYDQAGIAPGTNGVMTAVVAGVNIAGNIASGMLLQRGWSAPRLLVLGYCAMGVGALLTFSDFGQPPAQAVFPAVRYGAVLMFSAFGGIIPGTLFSLAVKLAPNERTVSTTVGWMQQLSAMGQCLGPPLVAWVAVTTGDWRSTWWVTGLCSVIGLALADQVRRLLQRLPAVL